VATIQEQILDDFYKQLETVDGCSKEQVAQIRELFSSGKKPKAAEVMKVFSTIPTESLK
jgi:hypothetical protein